jgi:hypothetical protein
MFGTVTSFDGFPQGSSLSALRAILYHSWVHQGLKSSSFLVVRLYDTFEAVEVHKVITPSSACLLAETLHQSQASDLARRCDLLLSSVRKYSPRSVGTVVFTEADEIERWASSLMLTVSDRCSSTLAEL